MSIEIRTNPATESESEELKRKKAIIFKAGQICKYINRKIAEAEKHGGSSATLELNDSPNGVFDPIIDPALDLASRAFYKAGYETQITTGRDVESDDPNSGYWHVLYVGKIDPSEKT